MSGHLGTAARMVPVAPSAAQSTGMEPRYTYQTSRSRRWAFDSSRPDGTMLRSWSIDLAMLRSAKASALMEFAQGQWGLGPFVWVPCSAHAGNALTPRQSALAGVANGSADGVEGWAPKAHLGPTSTVLAASVPILPDKPVSVGMDMSGGILTLTWRNAAGASVGTATKAATGSVMQRVVWSGVAPVTARTVDLTVSGHVAATRPQVVWGSVLPAYVPGQAASNVVLDEVSVNLIASRPQNLWDGSLSIVEVA